MAAARAALLAASALAAAGAALACCCCACGDALDADERAITAALPGAQQTAARPPGAGADLTRVWVVGHSGTGKTTTAARMAAELGALHVDLDEIRWLPNWQARPAEEARALLVEALAAAPGGRWVVSGNNTKLSAIMREGMTALVWARPGFYSNQRALWRRTAARWLAGATCCNGNAETLGNVSGVTGNLRLPVVHTQPAPFSQFACDHQILQLNDGSVLYFGWSAHARMTRFNNPKGKLQVIADEERAKGRLRADDIVTLRSMADADSLVARCSSARR